MTRNHASKAPATSRTRRLTIGAASVLTAGALLGTGVQGASATSFGASPEPTVSANASASAQGPARSPGTLVLLLQRELRADLAEGATASEKAQNVAETMIGHPKLFASLPANLQADTIALRDASPTERGAAANLIGTTALADGYGGQVTTVASAIRDNPEDPIGAAVRAVLTGAVSGNSGAWIADMLTAGPSVDQLAQSLINNPAMLAQLPASLQTELMALQNTPAGEPRTAAGQKIAADAAAGVYGPQVQMHVGDMLAGQAAAADPSIKAETAE